MDNQVITTTVMPSVSHNATPSARRSFQQRAVAFINALLALASLFLLPLAARGGNFYSGTSPTNVPWPGGIVPYEFTNTLNAAQQQTYLDGLREWELAANVKFVPHTNQTRWILFDYNTNGFDLVSAGYSPQVVTINNLSRAQVCHEMGHSFGFTHENIRRDATNYVAVLTNNIASEASNIVWFTIDPTSVTNGNYDFESVMHLGWDFKSLQTGVLATQQPKPPYFPRYQFRMGNFALSPGDRAALRFLYGAPAVPPTNIVTTTADAGPGSLRAALYYVTDNPGAIVRFNIPTNDPGYSNGVFTIHLTGQLPTLVTNGIVIDGSTQPGFTSKPLIVVDGSRMLPDPRNANTGLLIYSASNQVKNISFEGFSWNGLTLEYLDATNNTIAGCWLGLDSTGSNAAPNAFQGILIFGGASRNTIGGTNALARNVLSGNQQYGIFITDSNTAGNMVLGNYIGTDASGAIAVPNSLSGVLIGNGSSNNVIGGASAGARNVLSGNAGYGVILTDPNTTGNVVLGNYIGTDASGSYGVPDGLSGVLIDNLANNNIIGGTNTGARNILSGNVQYGIFITNTFGNSVLGNYIGLDASGNHIVSNSFAGLIVASGASNNVIGGAGALARNVISGNMNAGIWVAGMGANGNTVQGNFAGLNAAGTAALPNMFAGMYLLGGAQNNLITSNVFSGQPSEGLRISDAGTSGNVVQGNYFGTDATGTSAVPNGFAGLNIQGGASLNLVGGTTAGARNVISGNGNYGLVIEGSGTDGNVVEGNFIGTDSTGTNALGNLFANVALWGGATSNLIGGVGAGMDNVIAFGQIGVAMYDPETTNDSIRGNLIFGNSRLGIDLNGDGVTPNHIGFAAGPNNLQNFPLITNAFGSGNATIISGTLNSTANETFWIDVYRSPAAGPGGYGQGQFHAGSVSVNTDGSGNANFVLTNTAGNYAGQYFSATATSAGGDTSEFGPDLIATNKAVAAAQFVGPFIARSNGFVFTLALETNFAYRIQAATNLGAHPAVWIDLTNFTPAISSLTFTDRTATNYRTRFYRVVSP